MIKRILERVLEKLIVIGILSTVLWQIILKLKTKI